MSFSMSDRQGGQIGPNLPFAHDKKVSSIHAVKNSALSNSYVRPAELKSGTKKPFDGFFHVLRGRFEMTLEERKKKDIFWPSKLRLEKSRREQNRNGRRKKGHFILQRRIIYNNNKRTTTHRPTNRLNGL